MKASTMRATVLLASLSGLAACKPEAPPTNDPPVPKAATADATRLRDAIKQPIDKAKAVDAATQQAAEKQRADIDAATN